MGLSTGLPLGSIISQDEIYVEGAPYIYFQRYEASELSNPDADGYYWGLSGTSVYPVKAMGCVDTVSLTENLTMNDIKCDNVGVKSTIERRDSLDFVFNLSTLLPLSTIYEILNASLPTTASKVEKMGIGQINNNVFFHLYAPKVYDPDTGDFISLTLHKIKFVDAFTINMRAGEAWQVTGIKARAYFDDTKPAGQEFATILRADPSAL